MRMLLYQSLPLRERSGCRNSLSFRASDRCHWRGNPFPAPAGAEHSCLPLRGRCQREALTEGETSHERTPRCSSVGGDALIAPHTAPAVSFRASDRRHWRGNPFPAPTGAEHPSPPSVPERLSKGTFRAPARVTFGRSPKSDQKVCLKPKVSRLPARYVLLLLVVFTARSREFNFIVRSKGSSLRLRRCR